MGSNPLLEPVRALFQIGKHDAHGCKDLRIYRFLAERKHAVDDCVVDLSCCFCLSEIGQNLHQQRSEEHTSALQSLLRISYAVFCLKTTKRIFNTHISQLTI